MIELINRMTQDRDLKSLGETRINVLKLNIALDKEFKK
jgi:K+-transporting ATPase c subunit